MFPLVLCLSLAAIPVERASADAGSFFGGVVGGALGSALGNAVSRRGQPEERVIVRERVVTPTRSYVGSAQREENRRVQSALNYFGFGAGSADGVLGRNSRSAISAYQSFMGAPPTGHLDDWQRTHLLTSYDRALAGGPHTSQLVAQYGQGARGLLTAYQQPQPVILQQAPPPVALQAPVVVQQPQPQFAPSHQPTTQVVVNSGPAPQIPGVGPAPVEPAAQAPEPELRTAAAEASEAEDSAAPMMPSFIGGPVEASMASFCNRTSLVSNTNGGLVTAASLPQADPAQALSEQFCLARTYAIDEGERLSAQVQGVALAEMQDQCAAFAPAMRDYLASMVAKTPADATSDLQTFVIHSGMPPAQLAANSKICLSIGYRTDSADIVLASALVLVGLGEAGYGEMLAHHMAQGFGAPKRLDRAAEWYDHTVAALEGGAQRVVAPAMADRPALLRQAAMRLRGGSAAAAPARPAELPSFGMPEAPTQSVTQ